MKHWLEVRMPQLQGGDFMAEPWTPDVMVPRGVFHLGLRKGSDDRGQCGFTAVILTDNTIAAMDTVRWLLDRVDPALAVPGKAIVLLVPFEDADEVKAFALRQPVPLPDNENTYREKDWI